MEFVEMAGIRDGTAVAPTRSRMTLDRRITAALIAVAFAVTPACRHCGLGLHQDTPWSAGAKPGEAVFMDFPLSPQAGSMEIVLSSTSFAATSPGTSDAYLTNTSCSKLFDGPYPGSPALCKTLLGPVPTGSVSPHVGLDGGTYRVWVVGYSNNPDTVHFLIDVDLFDNSCRGTLSP